MKGGRGLARGRGSDGGQATDQAVGFLDQSREAPAIRKAQIVITGETNTVATCDVLVVNGVEWLVPKWLDSPTRGDTTPERAILLATLRHQRVDGMAHQFVVLTPIPRAVLSGPTLPGPGDGFVVVFQPPIFLKRLPGLH